MARSLIPVLLLLASAGSYAAETQPQSVSVLVPIVGSVVGVNNVRWKTDIDLFNDSRSEANVMLSLPTAPAQPFLFVSIAPGSRQHFTDIVPATFGMDATLSPLKITTIDVARSARRAARLYHIHATE